MIEKASKTKDIAGTKREFHFPGSGMYVPMTIEASSQQEAEAIWQEKRQLAGTYEKVEEKNNNSDE